jgi:hypothetical protein
MTAEGGLVPVEPGVWQCCRPSPEFLPARPKEPLVARRQGKRRGRGAGNGAPRPLRPAHQRLRSRASGRNSGDGCEAPGLTGRVRSRGERDLEAVPGLRLDASFGVTGVASGIEARQGRDAARPGAEHESPARNTSEGRRPVVCLSRNVCFPTSLSKGKGRTELPLKFRLPAGRV